METTGDFDRVREFDKLLFILALGINGLLDSRGVVLASGEFNSTDWQTALFLASQIQKENSVDSLLTIFKFLY